MIEAFLEDCRAGSLGACLTGEEEIAARRRNVSDFSRRIDAVLRPRDQDDVVLIVRLANEHRVPLYPLSQGKNWGLGSGLPCRDGGVVLDLGNLNRILDYSEEYGFIVVETGVSQKQVYEFLTQRRSAYYLDATGSGEETSVVGCALERGVAYNTQRLETVHSFKILTGSGRIIHTGQKGIEGSGMEHVWKHATGPDLAGLFLQSSFGIVLEATVQLQPRPASSKSFSIVVDDDAKLPACIQVARRLMRERDLPGIPHIVDRERLHSGMAPLLQRQAQRAGLRCDRRAIQGLLDRYLGGAWWIAGSLQGSRDIVEARAKSIKRAFRGHAGVRLLSAGVERAVEGALKLLRLRDPLLLLQATKVLRDVPLGRPSNEALYSVAWPFADTIDYDAPPDPDRGPTGYLFVVPGVPLAERRVAEFLAVLKSYRGLDDVRVAVSLNPLSHAIAEGVVSFSYPRKPGAVERAHRLEREFRNDLATHGFSLMRLGINQMQDLKVRNPGILSELKNVFDPVGIIAPGRYGSPPARDDRATPERTALAPLSGA
jgi:4-cresol dehydrogenase (hydroxylating)